MINLWDSKKIKPNNTVAKGLILVLNLYSLGRIKTLKKNESWRIISFKQIVFV